MNKVIDTETTEDSGQSAEVDTSTNEETQETDSADDLENDDTSFDIDDAEETDESEESTDDAAATKSDDDESEESDEDVEESESTEDDTTKVDVAKQRNNDAAQKRIAEREAKKQKDIEEYLEDAKDDDDRAIREERLERYQDRVERTADKIETALDKAVAHIPELTNGSPAIKKALEDAYQTYLRTEVVYSNLGDPVRLNGDVFQYLQKEAEKLRDVRADGAREQEKKKSTQKSRTDLATTRAPKEAKSDPLLDAFDEEVAKGR